MNKAACVALVDSRIKTIKMVTRKNNQLLGMPGGKLDPGETFREAAIRETFEETGVSLTHEQITEEPIYIGQVGDFEVATFLAFISDDQQFVQKEHGVKTVSLPVSSIADVNLVEFPEYNQHVRDELLKTTDMWGIIHDEKSLCFTEVSISAVENWLQLNSETIEYKQQTISLEQRFSILLWDINTSNIGKTVNTRGKIVHELCSLLLLFLSLSLLLLSHILLLLLLVRLKI